MRVSRIEGMMMDSEAVDRLSWPIDIFLTYEGYSEPVVDSRIFHNLFTQTQISRESKSLNNIWVDLLNREI